MILSGMAFAVMGAGVKVAAQEATVIMVVFFRNAIALSLLLPWLISQGPGGLATRDPTGHLVRGLSGLAAMICYFFAIDHMRLADAVLLNNAFPLFLPLAERVWLGMEPAPGTWRSLVLGFLGIVLILKPGSEMFSGVALVAVLSAVFAAVAQVGIRRLTHTEPIPRIVFYFGLIAACGSGLMLPFEWRHPSGTTWLALGVTGVFATLGQFALTRAYTYAPAAMAGSFVYTGVVFAALLDWLVWRTLPDVFFVPGALLVAVAGIWMIQHRPATATSPVPAPIS